MNYDKYEELSASSSGMVFSFVSTGTKGDLNKMVEFSPFDTHPTIYNLALATVLDDGTKDFDTESRNGDANKVLATIGTTAYIFSENNPDKYIFLEGNTPTKTRFYRKAINTAHDELCQTFKIYGVNKGTDMLNNEPFIKDKEYRGYIFKRLSTDDISEDLPNEND